MGLCGNDIPRFVVGVGAGFVDRIAKPECSAERSIAVQSPEALSKCGLDETGFTRPDDEVVVARQVLARLGLTPAGPRVAKVEYGVTGDGRGEKVTVDEALEPLVFATNH